jgi:hypothetical protein
MKYRQSKGRRIKSSCDWDAVIEWDDGLYGLVAWDNIEKKWSPKADIKEWGSTHSCVIRSVRAFRRRLRQWRSCLPKGTKLILVSKYKRNDVIGVIRG